MDASFAPITQNRRPGRHYRIVKAVVIVQPISMPQRVLPRLFIHLQSGFLAIKCRSCYQFSLALTGTIHKTDFHRHFLPLHWHFSGLHCLFPVLHRHFLALHCLFPVGTVHTSVLHWHFRVLHCHFWVGTTGISGGTVGISGGTTGLSVLLFAAANGYGCYPPLVAHKHCRRL
jgi:hypothetical protein